MKLYYFTMILSSPKLFPPEQHRQYSRILGCESAYMTEYMLRSMNREFKFDCRRINFLCNGNEESIRPGFWEFENVIEVDIPFDIRYFSMTPGEKEQYLFKLLTDGLQKLCAAKDWDFSLFEKHLDALKDSGFRVEFYLESKKLCRNGKYSAKIFAVQSMNDIQFYVDFFMNRTLVQRKPLTTLSDPRSMHYNYEINGYKWVDDKTVAVYSYDNTKVLKISMDV